MQTREQARRNRKGVFGRPLSNSREGELWERNQSESPLLRLPSELRNRIYELVLSVGHIHIMHSPPKGMAPRGGRASVNIVPAHFHCRTHDRSLNPFQTTPGYRLPDGARYQEGMTLLSAVCRQMYEETAPLPFQLNIISFNTGPVMDRFLVKEKRLPKPARQAIHSLALVGPWKISRRTEKLLGVRTIYVYEDRVRACDRPPRLVAIE